MKPAIQVSSLRKTFKTKRKAAGLRGSLQSLIRPEWRTIDAVRDVSFTMEPGEVLAFIGPNGAGKSTTIKMLTGILYPTAGEVQVMGLVPWEQRSKLAYHVGTVFGQRPQLWYHLPAIDTFYLFGKIYELDDQTIHKRISFLVEAFEIGNLLETPVRKLSLGQRMRCEVVASMLHSPQLLLLDEPSIGLDVVAKQRIRDTIKRMNQMENVGILLTSHDASDIEALCKRVIIVNHGRIVYDDNVATLKRCYLSSKQVEVRYSEEVPQNFHIPGTELLARGTYDAKLRFDTSQTPVDEVIAQLAKLAHLVDVTIVDPSLEEVIRSIFESAEMNQQPDDALVLEYN